MVQKNSRTIFRVILVPLMIVVALETALLGSALYFGGIFSQLEGNAQEILEKQIENRAGYLIDEMIRNWSNLDRMAAEISAFVQEGMDQGTLTLEGLTGDSDAYGAVLNAVAPSLMDTMYSKQTTGIYVIFCTDGAQGQEALPGICLRDLDPLGAYSSNREDILVYRAPLSFVNQNSLSTDSSWQSMFLPEDSWEQDFFRKPYEAASADGVRLADEEYGYWTAQAYTLSGDEYTAISYSRPLTLPDGTVYGVLGVELLTQYLEELLSFEELQFDNQGSYMLAVAREGSAELQPIMVSGNTLDLETAQAFPFFLTETEGDRARQAEGNHYAVAESLALYSRNGLFEEDRWYLLGSVPEDTLFSFVREFSLHITFVLVFFVLSSITAFVVVSRFLSRPVQRLAKEVEQLGETVTMHTLPDVGIVEIDQLVAAITNLSQEILAASEREKQQIETGLSYDALTPVLNRFGFMRKARALFADREKLKTAALLMLNLDNLKSFNDKYGNSTGDLYIQSAGEYFRDNVSGRAVCARISGDEFLVLYYGCEDEADARGQAESLFAKICATEFQLPDGRQEALSMSGGMAFYPRDSHDLDELMRMADFALLFGRKQGKGRLRELEMDAYNEMLHHQVQKKEFYQLLKEKALRYHFQPIFDARTGSAYAYEALMRLNMPNIHSPADVLKIAEEVGRMETVEALTMFGATASYRKLLEQDAIDKNTYLFINSIANVAMDDGEVEDFYQKYRNLARNIVIEITEEVELNMELTLRKKDSRITSGKLALDDYGSGYNTQLNLLALDPKYIKIDIGIIRDIHRDQRKQMLVKDAVAYAHQNGMLVVAEGLEYPEEAEKTLELGVDLLQGYFLAKPAEKPAPIAKEAARLIRDYWERSRGGVGKGRGTFPATGFLPQS